MRALEPGKRGFAAIGRKEAQRRPAHALPSFTAYVSKVSHLRKALLPFGMSARIWRSLRPPSSRRFSVRTKEVITENHCRRGKLEPETPSQWVWIDTLDPQVFKEAGLALLACSLSSAEVRPSWEAPTEGIRAYA